MYQDAESFRDFDDLERYAANPTLTYAPSDDTRVTLGYEYLRDYRTADRGITSFQGRPAKVDLSTFYGNPDLSYVRAVANIATATIEHRIGGAQHPQPHDVRRLRSLLSELRAGRGQCRRHAGDADQLQQCDPARRTSSARRISRTRSTLGSMRHTLLGGFEVGRQQTDNFRNTGFFNNTGTSVLAPFANPTIDTPVTYRQSATDADNDLTAKVAAAYVQDQVKLTEHVQLLAGVRFDRFDLDFNNHRNTEDFDRTDELVSPRAGLVVKPIEPLSLYASYSISYLPSSGDQFSSLTSITDTLRPRSSGTTRSARSGTCRTCRSLPPCTSWIAPTRARRIRTIRPERCRPAASAPKGSSSAWPAT